jgi:ribosomal protein L37AE/L43A
MADVPTIGSEAGWLSQHLDWIARQQWVSELDADVGRIWKDLRRTAGERREYRPRCPDCQALLNGLAGFWECGACGREFRDERMVTSCQQPMTGERIAGLFGISYSKIRVWQTRGRIEPAVDADGALVLDGGRKTYHIIDVLRLQDEGGTLAEARVGSKEEAS